VPFLPLERQHVRCALAGLLRDRRASGLLSGEFGDLRWDDLVLDYLTHRVEFEADGVGFALEGAKEARVAVARHVSGPLRSILQRPEHSGSTAVKLRVVGSVDSGALEAVSA